MNALDTRWMERFRRFKKAFGQLSAAVELVNQRPLSHLETQGLIQTFECTHELAWKTLKDFLSSRGVQKIHGARDATRQAFRAGLIADGETWIAMLITRKQTTHTYDEQITTELKQTILNKYYAAFRRMQSTFEKLIQEENR